MSGMTAARLSAIRARHPGVKHIRVFAETGTYLGQRASLAKGQFDRVYTVELSATLYENAKRAHAERGIVFEQGDSRNVVRRWALELLEPVVWYLDAHWFNGNKAGLVSERAKAGQVAGQGEGLPLWEELDAIAARPYRDVIVVDDVRDFGTEQPTPEWKDVSLSKIASFFPGHREAVVLHDQAVVYR
jgi:hypothetical protein